mmetsp:Transcript_19807/g.42847  ORF Transcript_19807/g.42847 Transcript_19807/m.42847 type:complete len:228 (+) Transcript_19807:3-686(+)
MDKPRLLCLHGFAQNKELFEASLIRLGPKLQKYFELVIPEAPILLTRPEVEHVWKTRNIPDCIPITRHFTWWRKLEPASPPSETYEGFDLVQDLLEARVMEGHFVGALGFSQGGALATILAGMQTTGALDLGLKFCIPICSHVPSDRSLFPGTQVPLPAFVISYEQDLHFEGTDTGAVKTHRALVDAFTPATREEALLPGKMHQIPPDAEVIDRIVDFARRNAGLPE